MEFIEVVRGESPLVLGLPHSGTDLPATVERRLNHHGKARIDTDWHIERLYADLVYDFTILRTRLHRYAIDVNRDPSGESLYPGQATTGLCPITDFAGRDIYQDGAAPDEREVTQRLADWHAPYHAALRSELARVRDRHGFVILYDCHSIRSVIPRLFEKILPDFNIGTDSGRTCSSQIEAAVLSRCEAARHYTTLLNGRFRGGWTTRHYGLPGEGMHAIQMELAQSTYLSEEAPPWRYDAARAAPLRGVLTDILETLRDWRPK